MKILKLVIAMLAFNCSFGQPLVINESNQSNASFTLHQYLKIVEAGESNFTFKEFLSKLPDLKTKLLTRENANVSFTNDHFWLVFSIRNSLATTKTYYLETARPITDYVHLYSVFDHGKITHQQSGDAVPYESRDLAHQKSVFKIELPPNSSTQFYLNLKSDGEAINLDSKLTTADEFIIETYNSQLIYGIFYGILLLAIITFVFFFFALGERSFIFYSLYVTSIGLMQFSLDGFFYQYFGPDAGLFSLKAVLLFAASSNFLFSLYCQRFLKINKEFKVINAIYNIIIVLSASLFTLVLFSPIVPSFGYPIVNVLALASLSLVMIAIVTKYVKKSVVDPFFTIAIFFLSLGYSLLILNNFGLLPSSFITSNSSKLGTGFEIIFLSLSMSNLIKKLKTEKEIAQTIALKKSEDMNELKTYFMSNMSHELRTPLNAIMGIADVMIKTNIDADIKSKFEIIKYSSLGLLSSVNDILYFSKMEQSGLKLSVDEFETMPLLDLLKKNAAKQAEDKGLVFNYEIDPDLPDLLIGDKDRLYQIINNVLGNALKFTNVGFVYLKIQITSRYDDTIELQITITDSGIGIPKDKMESVYELFTQESINNKRKFGGLGLGLSIVKKLVDLHGGVIKMESIVDHGTKCRIILPFKLPINKEVLLPKISQQEKDASFNNPSENGLNILLVEDNAINQLLMKMMMKQWKDVTFSIANHGEECLEMLQQQQYHLVLMDLQMPVMDGYEAAIAIRNGEAGKDNQHIPIIAITADAMEGTEQRVIDAGMNKYMTKPIDGGTLWKNIEKLTGLIV